MTGLIGAALFLLSLGFYAYKALFIDNPDWHTPENIMFFALLFLIYSTAKDLTVFLINFAKYVGGLVADLFKKAS